MSEKKVIVRTDELRRTYRSKGKDIEALRGVSFEIFEGDVFGFLGPNGAGKTTTIKILSTLLSPTSGVAQVLGYNCFGQEKNIRKQINFVFGGERGLYWRLSAFENLMYFGDLYKIPNRILKKRVTELIKLVGLSGREHERVEGYSKGMKQRVQIARGLVNDPQVLFLDEPTLGLDPVGANDLRELIKDLRAQGRTILLTTHYMQEADDLCNRIAIIDKGKILDIGTPEELKIKYLNQNDASLEEVYLFLVKEQLT